MITPEDIETRQVAVKMRGYAADEVDAFLDELAVDHRAAHAEIARLREELARRNRIAPPEEKAVGVLAAAQRTHDQVLGDSQRERDRIISEAQARADEIVSLAQGKAEEIIGQLVERQQKLKGQIAILQGSREEARRRMRNCIDAMGDDDDAVRRGVE